MKPIKMFGLVALAALTAMAFVGASSAMAENTALCTVDGATCASPVTHVHETSVGKGKLLAAGLPTIELTVLFLGDALNSGLGAPLVVHGNFTFTNLNNFCHATEENGPATISVLKTATELAAVTFEFLEHVSCPFINCSYTGEGLEGHGLGALTSTSANGNVTITGVEMHNETGGEICPPEAFMDLTTTPLVKTYISS